MYKNGIDIKKNYNVWYAIKPNQTEPNQTEPNQTELLLLHSKSWNCLTVCKQISSNI